MSLFVAGEVFGAIDLSVFVAGAVFGASELSLFLAGAIFGEVKLSLFVASAVFGEVAVSLLVASAICREIWNDSRSAKRCILQYKMPVVSVKSNFGCAADCILTVSWSEYARIMVGLVAHCK